MRATSIGARKDASPGSAVQVVGEGGISDLRSIKGGIVPKQHSGAEIFAGYQALLSSISELLQRGRQHAAKSVNAVLTTTYWLVGRRLVEYEQGGKERAEYGSELLKRLSGDLQSQLGRGVSSNLCKRPG
jgi:hypothetical protein